MAVDLAKYIVSLEAQTAQYVQQLDKANKKLDAFHRDQQRALGRVKEAFVGFAQGIAATLTVQAVVNFTTETIRMADAIGKTAKAAGVSAEELQRLRFAFGQLGGVAQNQTDIGLQRFNRTLGMALNGSKEAADAFKSLGVSIRTSGGAARVTDDALDDTLGSLADIADGNIRAARASKLFGEELGPKLAAALATGRAALEQTKAQVTGIISNENTRKAERLADAWGRLSTNYNMALRNSLVDFAATLAGISGESDILTEKLKELDDQIKAIRETSSFEDLTAQGVQNGEMLLNAPSNALKQRQIAALEARRERIRTQQMLDELDAWSANGPKPNDYSGAMISQEELVALETFIYDLNQAPKAVGMLTPEMEAFIDRTEEADRLTKSMTTEVEQQLERWREAKQLFDEGLIDKATLERVWDDILKPIDDIPAKLSAVKVDADEWAKSIGSGLKNAFADFLYDGEFKFRDFMRRIAAEFAASQLFNLLGSLGSGGSGGGVAKFFGKVFGGGKASGGSVSPNMAYVVGEKGPEIFSPAVSGRIIPNGGRTQSVSVSVHNHFDVGLETYDERLRAAAGPISSAATAAVLKVLGRPRMA